MVGCISTGQVFLSTVDGADLAVFVFFGFFLRLIYYLFIFKFYLFLTASGRSCGTWALRCGTRASLQLWRADFLFSSCGAQVPEHVGSIVCGMRPLVEAHELSSCGAQAQLLRGMWDLSSLTRDRTRVPCIVRWILYHWITREVPERNFLIFKNTAEFQCPFSRVG